MVKLTLPGGISAIFEPNLRVNPILSGARGAGIGIKNAIKMEISIKESEKLEIKNVINGEEVKGGIGEIAVKTFFEIMGIEPKYRIEINQKIVIPIGAGFGTSAASALGIVLGLSRELNSPLSLIEAGDIAHIAEIRAKTGLGTVSGLVNLGDIVIVSKPGAPSICEVDKIPLNTPDVVLIVASKGKKETSKALADKNLINKAQMFGKLAVDNLLKKPTLENFFSLALWFADQIGVLTKKIEFIINQVKEHAIGAAQAMIGDSIFAIAYREDADEVLKVIEDQWKISAIVGAPVFSGVLITS